MASCCSNGSSLISCACGCPGCRPHLISAWTAEEEAVFSKLTSIPKIQEYVDGLKYEAKPDGAWSARMTIRWGYAHCFGGSLFAAAALRNLGESMKGTSNHSSSTWQISCQSPRDPSSSEELFSNLRGPLVESIRATLKHSALQELVIQLHLMCLVAHFILG